MYEVKDKAQHEINSQQIPLITKEQSLHIIKMFKSGKFLPHVLGYMDYTYEMHSNKLDSSYKNESWSDYDPLYYYIMQRSHIWLENYWTNQMLKPKSAEVGGNAGTSKIGFPEWKFIMMNKFGWSSNPHYRGEKHHNINLNTNPSNILNALIKELSTGNMSIEKK